MKITERKWKIELIKELTLLIIVCGFIVSLAIFSVRLLSIGPSLELVEAASLLQTQESGLVLSHPKYGLWIQYYGGKATVLDQGPYFQKEYPLLVNQSYEAFYSHNLGYTKSLLETMNVSYLFITGEMKSSLIWNEPDQGLLFLLRNNETFKNIYRNQGTEIWMIIADHGNETQES